MPKDDREEGLSAYTGEHRDDPGRNAGDPKGIASQTQKKKKMTVREGWEGEGTVKGKKAHTCVATHTARDALFLFLDVGFCVEVEDDACLFALCDDCIYGEIKDWLFLFFTLAFCAPVAILERGDTV